MALPAHPGSSSVTGLTRFPAAAAVGNGGVLVVASDSILGEALAVALSACGVAARCAQWLPWRASPGESPGGAALVVAGDGLPSPQRAVGSLVGSGRRVAVLAAAGDPALPSCVAAGAEAVVPPTSGLNDLVTVLLGLGSDGPVVSPLDLGPLRFSTSGPRSRGTAVTLLERLTRREAEILTLLMAGKRAHAIARQGFVSLHTVRTQIRSILRKLEVHSQLEAVAVAHRAGWIAGGLHS